MKYSKCGFLLWLSFLSPMSISACHAQDKTVDEQHQQAAIAPLSQPYQIKKITEFNEPWALAVMPDQRLLITEKAGKLFVFNPQRQQKIAVEGVPQVAYGGQGGLGDVVLHPDFKQNHRIYFSYAEQGRWLWCSSCACCFR